VNKRFAVDGARKGRREAAKRDRQARKRERRAVRNGGNYERRDPRQPAQTK
jgi:hypothetical protein